MPGGARWAGRKRSVITGRSPSTPSAVPATVPAAALAVARRAVLGRVLLTAVLAVSSAIGTLACGRTAGALNGGAPHPVSAENPAVLNHVAFGSCNDLNREQPLWEHIIAARPNLFIWTGDIVYADRLQIASSDRAPVYVPLPQLHDTEALRRAYAAQRAQPGYTALRKATPIIGVYDDHDFGKNNGGGEYPHKQQTGALLLDFLDVPADSPRRRQKGVHATYSFGPTGKKVRVILLDARYHRGYPGRESTVLGPEQEQWLSDLLDRSNADVHLLISSFQVLPEDHPYETWGRFPTARARLFGLLDRTRPKGLLLISGDRHHAEYSELRLKSGFVLREITSSGLTHVYRNRKHEPNRHRQGPIVRELNFGLLTFDWDKRETLIEVRGAQRDPYISRRISHR